MPKIITSPIKRWPGTVTISDPLTMPQAHAIEDGMKPPELQTDGRVWLSLIDELKLPAVKACVEKWELEDFIPEPFPASPRGDSHKLIDWLFSEILGIYLGEVEIPNESRPPLGDVPVTANTAES